MIVLNMAPYNFVNQTVLLFRPCQAGELLVVGDCVACNEGTFLLDFDPNTQACQTCPLEV